MYNIQQQQQKIIVYKETKYGPFKEKTISTETIPLKELMADLLDKDVKIMVLKTLKELKENVEKVKKIMYEQNGNSNRKKT